MSETVDKLLDAAEGRIRTGGFHAVSFRDLAADLGIKSASVHYHFPKKEDLGSAVVTRYADRVMAALAVEAEGAVTASDKLAALIRVYRTALTTEDKACLCGVMGAEALGLPEPVRAAVRDFLGANIAWVAAALHADGIERAEEKAAMAIASLQGAMMLAVNLGETSLFDKVAAEIHAAATRQS